MSKKEASKKEAEGTGESVAPEKTEKKGGDKKQCQYCFAMLPTGASGVVVCEYCHNENEVLGWNSEIQTLLNQATEFRRINKYGDAIRLYDQIIEKDKKCTEALWQRLLAEYGVELKEDRGFKPTISCLSEEKITDHDYYKKLIAVCNNEQVTRFSAIANRIEEIRSKAAELAKKQASYDIFISFKKTKLDESGPTEDVALTNQIYHALDKKGLQVFWSEISLNKMAGQDFEPLIYHALSTSKIMILVGSKYEYINAGWVENEWSRFLRMKRNKPETKAFIGCYSDAIDLGNLAEVLRKEHFEARSQCLRIGDLDFKDNLTSSVSSLMEMFDADAKGKNINKKSSELAKLEFKKQSKLDLDIQKRTRSAGGGNADIPLSETRELKTAQTRFDKGSFKSADDKYIDILKENEQCFDAHRGRMYCSMRMVNKQKSRLGNYVGSEAAEHMDKAIEFAPKDKVAEFVNEVFALIKETASPKAAVKLFAWPDDIVPKNLKETLSQVLYEKAISDCKVEYFDASIKGIQESDAKNKKAKSAVDEYIDRHVKFANTLREKGMFAAASRYYTAALKVDEGCIPAQTGKLLVAADCKSYDDKKFSNMLLNSNIAKDKMMQVCIHKDEVFMHAVVDTALEKIRVVPKSDKWLKIFDEAITCIPEGNKRYVSKSMRDLMFILIKQNKNKLAEKYIKELLDEDNADDVAYLGLAMLEVKSSTLVSFVLQSKPIDKLSNFKKAQRCSDAAAETYEKLFSWQVHLSKNKTVREEGGAEPASPKNIQRWRNNLLTSNCSERDLLRFTDKFFKDSVETGDFGAGLGMSVKTQKMQLREKVTGGLKMWQSLDFYKMLGAAGVLLSLIGCFYIANQSNPDLIGTLSITMFSCFLVGGAFWMYEPYPAGLLPIGLNALFLLSILLLVFVVYFKQTKRFGLQTKFMVFVSFVLMIVGIFMSFAEDNWEADGPASQYLVTIGNSNVLVFFILCFAIVLLLMFFKVRVRDKQKRSTGKGWVGKGFLRKGFGSVRRAICSLLALTAAILVLVSLISASGWFLGIVISLFAAPFAYSFVFNFMDGLTGG